MSLKEDIILKSRNQAFLIYAQAHKHKLKQQNLTKFKCLLVKDGNGFVSQQQNIQQLVPVNNIWHHEEFTITVCPAPYHTN